MTNAALKHRFYLAYMYWNAFIMRSDHDVCEIYNSTTKRYFESTECSTIF